MFWPTEGQIEYELRCEDVVDLLERSYAISGSTVGRGGTKFDRIHLSNMPYAFDLFSHPSLTHLQ